MILSIVCCCLLNHFNFIKIDMISSNHKKSCTLSYHTINKWKVKEIMIYFWQNPSSVLLEKLYKHNESRSEENKLTFPEHATYKASFQYTLQNIFNTLCLSNIDYYSFSKLILFGHKQVDTSTSSNDIDEEKNLKNFFLKKN